MSRRSLLTGSTAERALACPASQALPWAVAEAGPPAERGTAMHVFLATVRRIGLEEALAACPDAWRSACAALDLDLLPQIDPSAYAAEVAFAYNVETGAARELGRGLTREQAVELYRGLDENEVPVTCDTVGLGADAVFVGDWKTGYKRVTPAARNAQVRLGALAASRVYGRSRASVAVSYLREELDPFVDQAELEEWDLDGFAVQLRAGAAAVRHARGLVLAGQIPDVYEGPHCSYCPAFRGCPAKVALLNAVAEAPNTFREGMIGTLHPGTAADVYRRWQLIKAAIDRVGEAIYAYALEHGGVDLGDGVVFGPVRSVREYVDGAVVRKVLTELHGPDIADRACTWDSSKAAIEDALRVVVQNSGGKITHLKTAALAAIAAAGGIDRRESAPLKEHRPKKLKGEAA